MPAITFKIIHSFKSWPIRKLILRKNCGRRFTKFSSKIVKDCPDKYLVIWSKIDICKKVVSTFVTIVSRTSILQRCRFKIMRNAESVYLGMTAALKEIPLSIAARKVELSEIMASVSRLTQHHTMNGILFSSLCDDVDNST